MSTIDAETYLRWLRTADLETTTLEDFRLAVEAVVGALRLEDDDQESGEMREALEEILQELHCGGVPCLKLEQFRQDFLYHTEPIEPPEVVLENEIREIASGLAEAAWSTETFQKLENAIDAFLDGGSEEPRWSAVDAIEELLERVSESYRQTVILPKEVTLESQVTHSLLCEGIEEWQSALALLRDEDSNEEPPWDTVLEAAERGNRLLVAVQIYHKRLQSSLAAS